MIRRIMENHEARLLHLERTFSRRHNVVTTTIAGVTSIIVALISTLI